MKTRVADSPSLFSGRDDLKLADVHPEFEELEVGHKVKAKGYGDSPQVWDFRRWEGEGDGWGVKGGRAGGR